MENYRDVATKEIKDEKVLKFMNSCFDELEAHSIKIIVSENSQVNTRDDNKGLNCSGFFEDRPVARLAIATGKPLEEWLPIFAHEFCHFRQYKEQSKYWTDIFTEMNGELVEATAIIDRWLDGEIELEQDRLNHLIRIAQQVERDCERRTVDLIKQFDLPIDIKDYSKKANAYTEFYSRLKETRLWYPSGGAPYQLESVYSAAPDVAMSAEDAPPQELTDALAAAYPVPSKPKSSLQP